MLPTIKKIQEANPEFGDTSNILEDDLEKYRKYYFLNFPNLKTTFGFRTFSNYRIPLQVFEGESSDKGLVLLVHGYFDHMGTWRWIIPELTKAGYRVVAFDLPGHGLSTTIGAERPSVAEWWDRGY